MSSPHAASNIESGAKTNVLPPSIAWASSTARVLPVPGSDVIKHCFVFTMKSVVVF